MSKISFREFVRFVATDRTVVAAAAVTVVYFLTTVQDMTNT